MKVRAKHFLKYNGMWYRGGETFEISTTEATELEDMIEVAETPVSEKEPEKPAAEQPKRRPRKAKAAE